MKILLLLSRRMKLNKKKGKVLKIKALYLTTTMKTKTAMISKLTIMTSMRFLLTT